MNKMTVKKALRIIIVIIFIIAWLILSIYSFNELANGVHSKPRSWICTIDLFIIFYLISGFIKWVFSD